MSVSRTAKNVYLKQSKPSDSIISHELSQFQICIRYHFADDSMFNCKFQIKTLDFSSFLKSKQITKVKSTYHCNWICAFFTYQGCSWNLNTVDYLLVVHESSHCYCYFKTGNPGWLKVRNFTIVSWWDPHQ